MYIQLTDICVLSKEGAGSGVVRSTGVGDGEVARAEPEPATKEVGEKNVATTASGIKHDEICIQNDEFCN